MIDAKEIKELSNQFGVDEIRITTAKPFAEALTKILEQKDEDLFLTGSWEKSMVEKFCNVQTVLPQAKSIIAACQFYLTDENPDLSETGRPYGLIARYTWRNHYLDLKKRLQKIAQSIKKRYLAASRIYSNGLVAEKPIAQRSGIGYYGKHSIIINPTYGSWIVLGEIITDVEIETDNPLKMDCGDCQKCIDTCPTKAIIRPYIIDRNRCIQALTNWYGIIPDNIARVWGNRLYGCVTCQEVCLVNKKLKPRPPRTDLGYVGSCLPLLEILQMKETEYRRRFSNNQITARWINFRAIKRNALIALGNTKDRKTLPVLKEFVRSNDEVLSKTARWAIANLSHD